MEDFEVITCNENEIKCKDCKWAVLVGFLSSSCVKFKRKPYDVYYENQDCPKFEEKKVERNG